MGWRGGGRLRGIEEEKTGVRRDPANGWCNAKSLGFNRTIYLSYAWASCWHIMKEKLPADNFTSKLFHWTDWSSRESPCVVWLLNRILLLILCSFITLVGSVSSFHHSAAAASLFYYCFLTLVSFLEYFLCSISDLSLQHTRHRAGAAMFPLNR